MLSSLLTPVVPLGVPGTTLGFDLLGFPLTDGCGSPCRAAPGRFPNTASVVSPSEVMDGVSS